MAFRTRSRDPCMYFRCCSIYRKRENTLACDPYFGYAILHGKHLVILYSWGKKYVQKFFFLGGGGMRDTANILSMKSVAQKSMSSRYYAPQSERNYPRSQMTILTALNK